MKQYRPVYTHIPTFMRTNEDGSLVTEQELTEVGPNPEFFFYKHAAFDLQRKMKAENFLFIEVESTPKIFGTATPLTVLSSAGMFDPMNSDVKLTYTLHVIQRCNVTEYSGKFLRMMVHIPLFHSVVYDLEGRFAK